MSAGTLQKRNATNVETYFAVKVTRWNSRHRIRLSVNRSVRYVTEPVEQSDNSMDDYAFTVKPYSGMLTVIIAEEPVVNGCKTSWARSVIPTMSPQHTSIWISANRSSSFCYVWCPCREQIDMWRISGNSGKLPTSSGQINCRETWCPEVGNKLCAQWAVDCR